MVLIQAVGLLYVTLLGAQDGGAVMHGGGRKFPEL